MKQSPYFNINCGWPYGTDGWNTGMDENLISLSFLGSHTVTSFVSSLPSTAPLGNAYILNTDGQVYIAMEDGWFFIELSTGYEFRVSSDNSRWRKTDSGFERIIAVDDTQGQLDSIDQQINSAGGIEERLASAELDIDSLESDVGGIQNDASPLSVTASSETRDLESWMDFLRQRGNHLGQLPTASDILTTSYDSVQYVLDQTAATIDVRMPSAARIAVNALDANTATLEDLILALQTT